MREVLGYKDIRWTDMPNLSRHRESVEMSVYVDNMFAGFGRMTMCHMLADSRYELDEMADKIGVARKWIQAAGTYKEHYDICMSKREQAIVNGAIEINWRDVAQKLKESRGRADAEGQK